MKDRGSFAVQGEKQIGGWKQGGVGSREWGRDKDKRQR